MLSINNIFSPAQGKPIVTSTQDIVLGLSYLSKEKPASRGEGMIFSNPDEVIIAYNDKEVEMHARIKVRVDDVLTWMKNLIRPQLPYYHNRGTGYF